MHIEDWRSQIKRGTLEFCVLLMIARGECYGYELITRLERRPILAARESTIMTASRAARSLFIVFYLLFLKNAGVAPGCTSAGQPIGIIHKGLPVNSIIVSHSV